jgi:hypothetical protein
LLCFDPESSADEKLIACVLNDSWFSADFSLPFHCTLFAPKALVQSFVALRSPSDNHEWSAVAPLNGTLNAAKQELRFTCYTSPLALPVTYTRCMSPREKLWFMTA